MNLSSRMLCQLFRIGLSLGFVFLNSLTSAQTVTYIHNDISGTPVMATDASGNVVWKENYRPYGERLNNPSAASGNQIGFSGKPFDSSTGLSYMGARYYDPVLGRFMGFDAADLKLGDLHSFNRYTYANNNPFKFVDPDGNSPITAVQMNSADTAIANYHQCANGPACVRSSLAAMVQVRNELRGAGVDLYDRSALNANIGQAAITLGDYGQALDATAAAGIVGLTQQQSTASRGATGSGKAFSKEKQSLVEMAKADKKTGMTSGDMQAYKDLNAGLPDPFPTNKVRGPEAHNSGAASSRAPHGHVGPVDHIPITTGQP